MTSWIEADVFITSDDCAALGSLTSADSGLRVKLTTHDGSPLVTFHGTPDAIERAGKALIRHAEGARAELRRRPKRGTHYHDGFALSEVGDMRSRFERAQAREVERMAARIEEERQQ